MKDQEVQQAGFFDSESKYFSKFQTEVNHHGKVLVDYFKQKLIPFLNGKNLLEIGAGTGMYTIPFLKDGFKVTGIDISKDSLNICKELAQNENIQNNLQTECISVYDLKYKNEFNGVFGKHILHHLERLDEVAATSFTVLKDGGVACYMEPNPLCPLWYFFITLHPKRKWSIEKGILKIFPSEMKRIFLNAGFKKVEISYYGIIPGFLTRRVYFFARLNSFFSNMPILKNFLALQTIIAIK